MKPTDSICCTSILLLLTGQLLVVFMSVLTLCFTMMAFVCHVSRNKMFTRLLKTLHSTVARHCAMLLGLLLQQLTVSSSWIITGQRTLITGDKVCGDIAPIWQQRWRPYFKLRDRPPRFTTYFTCFSSICRWFIVCLFYCSHNFIPFVWHLNTVLDMTDLFILHYSPVQGLLLNTKVDASYIQIKPMEKLRGREEFGRQLYDTFQLPQSSPWLFLSIHPAHLCRLSTIALNQGNLRLRDGLAMDASN